MKVKVAESRILARIVLAAVAAAVVAAAWVPSSLLAQGTPGDHEPAPEERPGSDDLDQSGESSDSDDFGDFEDFGDFGDFAVETPSAVQFRGFVDARGGYRLFATDYADRASLGELRAQLALSGEWSWFAFGVKVDGIADPALNDYDVDLETGDGAVDIRSLFVVFSPWDFLDIKLGRQVATWGTGDLVFINDLFPKDWTAFLIGRDLEYLKAPSDAARLSVYSEYLNVDIVFTPRFDADRFPDRRRVVSFEPTLGRVAGADAVPRVGRPDAWFKDYEWAARIRTTIESWDVALYGYYGFWKSPAGFSFTDAGNPAATGAATFPALATYGASVRGPLGGGVLSFEGGHYLSLDDTSGDDPWVRNSEVRWLVGYEREVAPKLTVGLQYYGEWMLDFDGYESTLPPGTPVADEVRHVLTSRVTWRLFQERLTASLFVFFSPSDVDAHIRPHLAYAIDDTWRVELGGSLFFGQEDYTFFGQLQDNSSAYVGVRAAW